MNDIVRPRARFMRESRDVVVLDVIPPSIEKVEHIERDQPVVTLPEPQLSIDRGVGGRFGAVILY